MGEFCGVYPTMITPFREDGEIDYPAVRAIVDYYVEKGCAGIFAVCQSSEMTHLSLDERVMLARTVVEHANGRIDVIASGHCADSVDEQIKEINAICETGISAFVTVSNRFDIGHDGDDIWLANAERVLSKINGSVDLGIYECPAPYKRFLTPRILKWCLCTGRFKFIKDTCCDPKMLKERLELLRGTTLKLYNANAQTLLYSLKLGAAGYSGVMANFHPELYVWLCNYFRKEPEKAERLQEFLTLYAFSECMCYPVTAKYHMNLEGIRMCLDSRQADKKKFTEYEKMVVEQEREIEKYVLHFLEEGGVFK